MSSSEWSHEEYEILKRVYPTRGPEATTEALEDAGYSRTYQAVVGCAHKQSIRCVGHIARRHWTDKEWKIIKDNYHLELSEIQKLLRKAGYERTRNAIEQRAQRKGLFRAERYQRNRQLTPFEQAQDDILLSLVLKARDKIESGELQLEQDKDDPPVRQAISLVFEGLSRNPGIMDELVSMRLGEAS